MCCGSGRGAGVAGAYVFVVFECPRVSLPTKLVFSRDVHIGVAVAASADIPRPVA